MWSKDSSNSLIVAKPTSALAQKSIPAMDGGVYTAWIDSVGSLYVQRIDASGNLLWPLAAPSTDGILILTRHLSYVYDFGCSVDAENNILIGIDSGYNDGYSTFDSPGGKALAFKLSPKGEFLFGEEGIVVSPDDEIVGQVYCVATSDNGVILSWDNVDEDYIRTVKLDASGQQLWGDGKVTEPLKMTVLINDITPDDNGGAILSFIYAIPPFIKVMLGDEAKRELLAQKFTSEGNNAWAQKIITVYTPHSLSYGLTDGVKCPVVDDGAGGAVFAIPAPNPLNKTQIKTYIQHVLPEGQLKFADNGVAVSTNSVNSDLVPFVSYDVETDTTFALWNATKPNEEQSYLEDDTVVAQMITGSGTRAWSDEGVQLEEWYTNGIGSQPVGMYPFNDGTMAMWIPSRNRTEVENDTIRAAMLNSQGEYTWATQTVDLKTNATQASSYNSLKNTDNTFAVAAWIDNSTPVRAQNINEDGTLGE
ncbi:hypothetical protein LMA04_17030 [Pseudescherichia vulneris]|uniref:hypothetical protein n=1 Tax=Pseudescherichia vulneris TaxID=566 RepID=UPI00227BC4A9|nr:hypothetical protein [Pseudescherichia vulneris]WAH51786.1 hypothetical protein LMA04_17030 [Pseudescherichia vulneris]